MAGYPRQRNATGGAKLAILPQTPVAPEDHRPPVGQPWAFSPQQNWLRQWSEEDDQQVNEALRLTGTASLQHRPVDALSGGQRQRVWIAMTLAQATGTLLLDEPTTYLDWRIRLRSSSCYARSIASREKPL